MNNRLRVFVAPAYLMACLILGGSAQGIWQNMLLQLAGLAIIGWAALDLGTTPDEPLLSRPARQLLLLAILALLVVLAQMIPLPGRLWADLGPRGNLARDFRILNIPIPAEPVSLTPAAGLSSVLAIIPPIALFCAIARLRLYRAGWLAFAIIFGTLAGTALGALQVASAGAAQSAWYLYDETNPGKAVGFFANADHMATLLVITIPFVAATVAAATGRGPHRYAAAVATGSASAVVIVIGLVLNGSLAGYTLALPVIAASALIILPRRSRARLGVICVAALLAGGSLMAIEMTAIGSGKLGEHAASAVQSRAEIMSTTARAAADFMPFGSGLGSFENVYHLYEVPEQVTSVYVVHAHNDYAELALELGLPGIILMLLFLVWWSVAVWRASRTNEAGPFARAAAIASAAILVHSIVDFPLRTAAIAASFAMCLALLSSSRAAPPKQDEGELRPARHVIIR
jgi:O-antigen ligase